MRDVTGHLTLLSTTLLTAGGLLLAAGHHSRTITLEGELFSKERTHQVGGAAAAPAASSAVRAGDRTEVPAPAEAPDRAGAGASTAPAEATLGQSARQPPQRRVVGRAESWFQLRRERQAHARAAQRLAAYRASDGTLEMSFGEMATYFATGQAPPAAAPR